MRKDYSQQIGQRIAIHNKEQCRFVDVSLITHINSESKRVITHTTELSIPSSIQLKEFEEELTDLGFIRINRTTIINQAHVKSYTGGDNKSIELTNGQTFTVSRRKVHLIK